MSLGLMSAKAFADPAIPPLSKGTPSTTIKGSLLAFMEVPPRIRMLEPEPGAPSLEVIFTPATLPIISCSGVATGVSLKSFSLI